MPRTKRTCTFYPPISLDETLRAIATEESRSKASMICVLLKEALAARNRRAAEPRNLIGV